jgi:hypothetical protein
VVVDSSASPPKKKIEDQNKKKEEEEEEDRGDEEGINDAEEITGEDEVSFFIISTADKKRKRDMEKTCRH